MRVSKTIYRAVHDETGETHEGVAKEIADILCISTAAVNKASLQYCKIAKHWMIRKAGILPNAPDYSNCKFPQELLDEWDAVTLRLRMAYRKKMKV